MSKVLYCDHCEKLFSEEHNERADITFHQYSGEILKLDLCEDCHEQLIRWVYGKENLPEDKDVEDKQEGTDNNG